MQSTHTCTGWPKHYYYCVPWLYQISTDFQNYFTVRIRSKFVIVLSLKIPLHLKCVATLQIFSRFWPWNNFENRLIFGKVKAYISGVLIFGPPCIMNYWRRYDKLDSEVWQRLTVNQHVLLYRYLSLFFTVSNFPAQCFVVNRDSYLT